AAAVAARGPERGGRERDGGRLAAVSRGGGERGRTPRPPRLDPRAAQRSAPDAAVVDHWLGHRNKVASFRSFLEQGVVVDTIEVAATWTRIGPLYDGVVAALSRVPCVVAAHAA